MVKNVDVKCEQNIMCGFAFCFRSDDKVEPKKEVDAPTKEGDKTAADGKEAPKEEKASSEEKMEHWGPSGFM